MAHLARGDHESAARWQRHSASANPQLHATRRILIAALVPLGRHEEAADIAKELAMLKDLMPCRDGALTETLAQRNGLIPYCQGIAGFSAASHPRTTELLLYAMTIAGFMVMPLKYHHSRPRPWTLMPELVPPIDVPGHPAYPSGHAMTAHLMAGFMLTLPPEKHPGRDLMCPLAERIAINREVVGVHHRSDSEAGRIAAELALDLAHRAVAYPAADDAAMPLPPSDAAWAQLVLVRKAPEKRSMLATTWSKAYLEWSPA
jgi:membrane-associated phospholipid phosphatase